MIWLSDAVTGVLALKNFLLRYGSSAYYFAVNLLLSLVCSLKQMTL